MYFDKTLSQGEGQEGQSCLRSLWSGVDHGFSLDQKIFQIPFPFFLHCFNPDHKHEMKLVLNNCR